MSTDVDYLGMSDEEMLRAPPPKTEPVAPGATVETGAQDEPTAPAGSTLDHVESATPVAGADTNPSDEQVLATPPAGDVPAGAPDPNAAAEGGKAGEEGGDKGTEPTTVIPLKTEPVAAVPQELTAMATELATLMQTGIKANGKVVQIRNIEEATKLLQMGSNYTQKMQQLQPAMRIVKMLSNNELLDEGKIAFLIDLSQKNPAAIQRLLADSDFDPLAADKAKADSYTPGNHGVSDTEVQFQSALDDLIESDGGAEFLKDITGQWDQESKQALWKEPSLLGTLHQQRSNGIYPLIKSEIDRLSALGQIPVGTPFLQAYRAVGDMLNEQGKLGPKPGTPAGTTAPVVPAAPPAQAPAAPVTPPARGPSEAAREAAPVKATTTKPATATPNFLAESDEAFLKRMEGRL